MIPCEQCLKLAVCRNRDEVKCKDLVSYLFPKIYYKEASTFTHGCPEVEDLFNRRIMHVSTLTEYITFREKYEDSM